MSRKELADFVLEQGDKGSRKGEHYMFELWDVEERSPAILEQMRKDGVIDQIEPGPHPFQSGILYESPKLGAIFAGNQTGKTKPVIIDLVCATTGEYPHSMRYDKGVDTGIKREVHENNIRRWGRFDARTGEFLDHDWKRPVNTLEWDCGTIIGTGKYPEEKRIPKNSIIWVGTLKQARDEHWMPTLRNDIPDHCLDKNKGTGGFMMGSNGKYGVYLKGGIEVHIITYEQGYERFEAAKLPWIILDEEPLDERIFTGCLQRAKRITLVETPYRGMTFTYHRIKKASGQDNNIVFYHCTQYDSPYKFPEDIAQSRSMMPKWEIEARLYGLHSEQVGKPYFHDMYDTLATWLKDYTPVGLKYDLTLPAGVSPQEAVNKVVNARIDRSGLWEVYEEPKLGKDYWLSADTARGDEGGDVRVDANSADVFRHPIHEKGEDMDFPVCVAHLRTVLPTIGFARECLAGAVWYNGALLAPESQGFSAGTFINELHGYPYMYNMTLKDDRTSKMVERIGFNTNTKTRQMLFDSVGEYIAAHRMDSISPIKNRSLIGELIKLIVDKNGRPDHPKGGTSDSVISFAIGLYIFKYDKAQCSIGGGSKSFTPDDGSGKWGDRINTNENNAPMKRVFAFRR